MEADSGVVIRQDAPFNGVSFALRVFAIFILLTNPVLFFMIAPVVVVLCAFYFSGLRSMWFPSATATPVTGNGNGGGGLFGSPSAPAVATAVPVPTQLPQTQGPQGGSGSGSDPESKGCMGVSTGVSTYSSTTTTTVSGPTAIGVLPSVRNVLSNFAASLSGQNAADGAYTSLPAEERERESVHGSVNVTEMSGTAPVIAQQQGSTHWI